MALQKSTGTYCLFHFDPSSFGKDFGMFTFKLLILYAHSLFIHCSPLKFPPLFLAC